MLFNSLEFAIFLPLVFLLYWFVFDYALKNCKRQLFWQNLFVVVASYVFYGWWDWKFLSLLFGISVLSWCSGIAIEKYTFKRAIMLVNTFINICILGFFKYYNFFIQSFADLFRLDADESLLCIVLPLGISFFIFQAIAYPIDIFKGKLKAEKNPILILAYIGFFPKLLAGPIERPTHFIPQLKNKRIFTYEQGVDGVRQIIWGLFKKIVIADNCATFVNNIWADFSNHSSSTLLLTAILYSIQIYGDFSGYSDMAIGVGKLFGFEFKSNFLFPYFSRNMNEFWRRWHISLNTWFVDYIYIPLGGSRCSKVKTIVNTMIIFLLSGLWHGANWTFVCWGLYHGCILVILILFKWNKKYDTVIDSERFFPSVKGIGQMALTFILATIGWIMFRADSITQFADYMHCILNNPLLIVPKHAGINFLLMNIIFMFSIEWYMRRTNHGLDLRIVSCAGARHCTYLIILYLLFAFSGHTTNYIYMFF